MTGENERLRNPCSLYAPSPLIRTSSGTQVRPTPKPRSTRHSGEPLHLSTRIKSDRKITDTGEELKHQHAEYNSGIDVVSVK